MSLSANTWTPAGQFGEPCEVATLDLRRHMRDQVLRSIPRFLVRIEDNTTMPVITDWNWDTVPAANVCDPTVASTELLECSVLLPNQKRVLIATDDNIPYVDMMQKFCDARRLLRFPTLFNADGTFDTGEELAGPFLRFLLADLKLVNMRFITNSAWNGDQANIHEMDGILTQLTNGYDASGAGCELYQLTTFDWGTLTGNIGIATHPSATIDAANDVLSIHGKDYAGNTGQNLAQLFRSWIERIMEGDLAQWAEEEIIFEIWTGIGQTNCLAEIAACLQPCNGCVDPMSDPDIRMRSAEFYTTKSIYLYPWSNIRINMITSPFLNDEMILFPKSIGGRPTIAWLWRDQQEELAILNGELPWFGSEVGVPDSAPPLYNDDGIIQDPASLFEQRAFSVHLSRNGDCIEASIASQSAIYMFAVNTWLRVTNVSCTGLINDAYIEDLSTAVTACAVVDGDTLTLTVADLELAPSGEPVAGDTMRVTFVDGELIGTVVSYNTGTDALILDFSGPVTCSTGGGIVSVTKLADN